jgi:hypothetical protein
LEILKIFGEDTLYVFLISPKVTPLAKIKLLTELLRIKVKVISDFLHHVDEICALLGHYAA